MYLEHFGLHEKPFHITPDPRFFYPSFVSQEAYASLFYGITEKKGFIALTGEVGTGKTTLLRRLMLSLNDSVSFAFVYNTTWTFDEVLDSICTDFSLPSLLNGKRFDKVQALNLFLLEQLSQGRTAAVLVDEAHNLSIDVLENLRLLSNLETGSEKLLQIVLVGQNELEEKLLQPNLRQVKDRIAIWTRLDRLKKREVSSFIFHRLHVAGYEKEDLFTPEAIDRIAFYSHGSPRQINIICDNALLAAYGTYKNQVFVEIVEEVAQDLGLTQKKPKSESPSDSNENVSSSVKTSSQVDVITGARLARDAETAQKEETTKNGRKREPSFYSAPADSKFARYVTFLALFLGAIVAFVFQNSRANPVGLHSLASRMVGLFQARHELMRKVEPSWLTPVLPVLSNSGETSKHQGEKSLKEAELKVQANLLPEPRNDNDSNFMPTEGASTASLAPVQPEQGKQANFSALSLSTQEHHDDSAQLPESPSQAGQFITVARGGTVLALVSHFYGSRGILALSLLKEANPQINDLDRVIEGDRIWLPPLTQETLLHQEPDGSYRVVLSSFLQRREAEQLIQALRVRGYTATVSPQQVSSTLKLYRVEIEGLWEGVAVEKAWKLALTQDFAAFARSKRKVPIVKEPNSSSQG